MIYFLLIKLIDIILGYLLADFIIGIIHWFKDTYFSPFTPLIGKTLIWGSRLHHIRPKHILEYSNITLIWDSAKWFLLWYLPLIWFLGINVFNVSLFIIMSLNDVIHKYAHMRNNKPIIIDFLQKNYIIQSSREHHQHHISPHEMNYCPITPYMNTILESINFWRFIENIVEHITGVSPRSKVFDYIEDLTYPGGIKFVQ